MKTWQFFLAFAILSFAIVAYCVVFTIQADDRAAARERTLLLQCLEDDGCDYAKTQAKLEFQREPAPWQVHVVLPSTLVCLIGIIGALITKPFQGS